MLSVFQQICDLSGCYGNAQAVSVVDVSLVRSTKLQRPFSPAWPKLLPHISSPQHPSLKLPVSSLSDSRDDIHWLRTRYHHGSLPQFRPILRARHFIPGRHRLPKDPINWQERWWQTRVKLCLNNNLYDKDPLEKLDLHLLLSVHAFWYPCRATAEQSWRLK